MAHSVFRSQILAGLVAVSVIAVSSTALAAKKKKAGDPFDEASTAAAPAAGKPAQAASQSNDQERPKPILQEETADAPAADEKGNVTFTGAKAGRGKIIVKAPAKEQAKVFLEGRYFGVAPRTINKVPPGDYIIEVTYPDGKSVTKPVSVAGDEEAVIELGGSDEIAAPAEKPMAPEKIEKRLGIAKIVGFSALGLLAIGGGLSVWEYTVQQDYNKKINANANRQITDDLQHKGETLALAANICFVGAAAGLITAGIIGYPAWKARRAERRTEGSPEMPPPVTFLLAPGRTLGSFNAGVVYTF